MKQTLAVLLLGAAIAAADAVAAEQGGFLLAGDNLVVEGIPKIPARLADQISRYTDFRVARLASWHPTRREMLVLTRFADTYQVHLVRCPGGARTQLTFFQDSVNDATYQPTRGDYFVFEKDSNGDENYQKYRYDFATGTITRLTEGKSRNTGGQWSNAGDRFVYGSTRRNGKDVDLWIMNPAEPKTDRMLAQMQGGGWSALDFSRDDRWLLVSEYLSANESHLWLLDTATGERRLITPKGSTEKTFYGVARFSGDSKGIYVTTDLGSDFHRLAYINLATGRRTCLTGRLEWDVDSFCLSWDGRTIAYSANEDGLSVLHLLDTRSGKERPAPELPPGLPFPIRWHKNNRDLGFSYTSAGQPVDCYSFDIKTRRIERWTTSETGGLNTGDFSAPEIVQWPSFDGRTISGLLYKPPTRFKGKRPVIIDIHGGPEFQARPWFQGENNYFVNELGVALLQPNVRGSTGYGKAFLQLDDGLLREGAYKDIGALLDWIGTREDLDADRIMVTGQSYGGHMTLATACYYPDRIRCALEVVGQSNLASFLEHTSGTRQDLRRAEYGDERDPAAREFLNRTAPLNNASRITKPLFIVQGGKDPRVPLSESELMIQAIRKNGTPVWYLMAKDEGHGFAKKRNRDFLLYSTVLFINQYLLN